MKKLLAYSLFMALMICSCQVEEIKDNVLKTAPETITEAKVFTAIIEDSTSGKTKTSLDGSGNVLWKQGDQVSIFAASTVNEQYQVTDESDGKTSASLYQIPGGFVAGTEIDNNVAFYPYASTASIAKSGGSYIISDIELPASQNYAESSFGNGAFPMTAVTNTTADMNLKFKNVLGGLKLQLKGTATITSITVMGNNNEILCGDAEVTVAYGSAPSISLTDASAKTVTLDCGAGVALDSETATTFIIALPPITMTGGFTVRIRDTDYQQMEITTTKPQTITRSKILKMPTVDYVGSTLAGDYSNQPFTITSIGSTKVYIGREGSPDSIDLEYRVDSGEWTAYTIDSYIALSDGQCVQIRAGEEGNATFSKYFCGFPGWEDGIWGEGNNSDNYRLWVSSASGTIVASGNIMSLLDRSLRRTDVPANGFAYLFGWCSKLVDASNLILPATTLSDYCYSAMFGGCTRLTSAPTLPATALSPNCYRSMFSGCTELTSAPELPANTLESYCYARMFEGCTGLTTAPVLSATVLAQECYEGMFSGCTGLTSAPELPVTTLAEACYANIFAGCSSLTSAPELPATTLADYCYWQMFKGCTGLTSAPELPVTTLAEGCYMSMFENCIGLTSAPTLPATTLASACYAGMFSGCTSLASAPELPATTIANECYGEMFSGCTSLASAPELPATTIAYACYANMFKDCIGLTSVPELPAATAEVECYFGMFSGCTGLTSAPELPSTTLERGCYQRMFLGCTSLISAPELPATTLANYCYQEMFKGCTSLISAPELPAPTLSYYCYGGLFSGCTNLNYIKCLAVDKTASYCTFEWTKGVSNTGTFVKKNGTSWSSGIGGIPSGWTVIIE